MNIDTFVHVANVGFLCSYLVRDILWLRSLTIVAIFALGPYYYHHDLWAPIAWGGLFVAINVVQIYLLILERRPVRLSAEEQELYQLAFRTLTPREMLKLLKLATWRDAKADDELVAQDVELEEMMVIHRGTAAVKVDGREVATLQPGHFIGEMSFLIGGRTSASVVAEDGTRVAVWPKETLRAFLDKDHDLHIAFQGDIGQNLVRKLKRSNARKRRELPTYLSLT